MMEKEYLDPRESYQMPLSDLQPLKIHCPGCGQAIESEQVNVQQNIAKCDHCKTVYQVNHAVPFRQKPEIYMPKGIEVFKISDELDIELSWKKGFNGFLVFFTLMWNSIVFIGAAAALLSGNFMPLLFMSAHIAIGISLIYYHLTLLLNRTNIMINQDRMLIEHRPLVLPFYGDKNIPIADIKQVFVEKYVASTSNDVPNYAFSVSLIQQNNKRLKLVKGILHIDQARYIEQEIENFLLIPDEKVSGEYEGKGL